MIRIEGKLMSILIKKCLKEQAIKLKDRPAVIHRNLSISFCELNDLVDEVSKQVSKIVPIQQLVSINAHDQNWCSFLVGYLGIVCSGRIAVLSTNSTKSSLGLESTKLSIALENSTDAKIEEISHEVNNFGSFFKKNKLALDVIFTSGSTGKPLPYLFEHDHFIKKEYIRSPKYELHGMHVNIPFHTSTGVHGIALRHLQSGITSIATDNHSSWSAFCKSLDQWKPFEINITPFELKRLLDDNYSSDAHTCVRSLRVYAGALSEELRLRAEKKFLSGRITSLYGLTEAGSAAMTRKSTKGGFEQNTNSTFRIWNNQDNKWAIEGQMGEIVAKMNACDSLPVCLSTEKDTNNIPKGWISTGDIGYHTSDNEIIFCTRAKEIVMAEGERQIAHQLESELSDQIKNANEIMVFNYTSSGKEQLGLILAGHLTLNEIATQLSRTRVITDFSVVLTTEITHTDLGKIARMKNAMLAADVFTKKYPCKEITGANGGKIEIFVSDNFDKLSRE